MLAILDYNAGNQTSVRRALDYLDIPCEITADPEKIAAAKGLIFPGVGAAGQAMDELRSSGLDKVLGDQVKAKKPLLGICVGCQILLDYSQENDTKALGLIPGECRLFDASLKDENGEPIRVPHMGWNSLSVKKTGDALLANVDPDAEFYFVHSYFPAPNEKYVIAATTYGTEFCSMLGREGLWAVQFHPEKSGRPGLMLLKNFFNHCQKVHNAK